MRILLATRNGKKLVELRRILSVEGLGGDGRFDVVGLSDVDSYPDTPETGATFADNALAKAREGVAHTGLPTVADDSGLAVDALNGMPGVLSARWSGGGGDRAARDTANLELVLAQVADVPEERLGARFVCAAALALPDGRTFVTEGTMPGRLVRSPRGTGGFGYDPIFVADGFTRTNAELAPEEKDAISHRGKALRALAGILGRELPETRCAR